MATTPADGVLNLTLVWNRKMYEEEKDFLATCKNPILRRRYLELRRAHRIKTCFGGIPVTTKQAGAIRHFDDPLDHKVVRDLIRLLDETIGVEVSHRLPECWVFSWRDGNEQERYFMYPEWRRPCDNPFRAEMSVKWTDPCHRASGTYIIQVVDQSRAVPVYHLIGREGNRVEAFAHELRAH